MDIAGYIKTSLIEWPGKIASVIFVPGCNFRCPFCHNADLVDNKVEKLPRIKKERIIADLKKRKKWIDGVVITGGEPTLQRDLLEFLKIVKSLKLLTMVHTNGSKPEVVEKLIKEKLVDCWAMDVKGNFDNYQNFTNVKTQISNVKSSLNLILKSGMRYELRTTVVPGLHDRRNLTKLAEQIREVLANFSSRQNQRGLKPAKTIQPKWYLQQFRPINTLDKNYLKVKPYSKEELTVFLNKLQKIIPQTSLRGV